MTSPPLAAALALHRRGFALVPVPLGQKRPVRAGWQHLRLAEADLRVAFGPPANIGVLLGEPSGGLTDVDLDGPEALALAPAFLPPSDLRSGRSSAPGSHVFYRVATPLATTRYRDPLAATDARGMLVELRSTGAQTLVPPSVHPSGEEILWESDGEPTEIAADVLRCAVNRLAAASLLARHWPPAGSRHDVALALGGGLLRAEWPVDEAAAFVWRVAMAAGDEEADDRHRAVQSTADALTSDQPATGWPRLATLLNPRLVDAVRSWLEITRDAGPPAPVLLDGGPAAPLAPPPPFPVEVFPPVIATFVQRGAAAFGVPADFIAIPLLGFASGVLGSRRCIEVKPGWTERAILWMGVVGRPGSGKSPGMTYAQQLIDPLQHRAWTAYQEALAEWKSGQDTATTGPRAAGARAEPPRLESFYTTDATIEAIAALTDASPGVCMIRDELVGWVKSHDAYRQAGDRQTWLSLWAGSSLKIDRKSAAPMFIPAPSVSVVGGLQPDRLPDLREAAARDDGFVDRLLLGWPEAPAARWTDATVQPSVIADAQQVFAQLRDLEDESRRSNAVTRFDEPARRRFIAWHNDNVEIMAQAHGLAEGWAAKYPRQVARLALVLHALHAPDVPARPVPVAVVDGAVALIEYFRGHLPRILTQLGQPGTVAAQAGVVSRVATVLRAAAGWCSRTDLHAGLSRNVSAAELSQALDHLAAEGVAERRTVPTEGRAREEWRLRPNEETKKGAPDLDATPPEQASFVSSFVRGGPSGAATCCLCDAPLPPGRHYLCEPCAEDGIRRNELRSLREDRS